MSDAEIAHGPLFNLDVDRALFIRRDGISANLDARGCCIVETSTKAHGTSCEEVESMSAECAGDSIRRARHGTVGRRTGRMECKACDMGMVAPLHKCTSFTASEALTYYPRGEGTGNGHGEEVKTLGHGLAKQ